MRFPILLAAVLALAACGSRGDDGIVDVAFIGEEQQLLTDGVRMSFGAQHVRAATREGLVSLDASGAVVPAIAERWIVTDDGSSYIFRLRDSAWPDGSEITGESVRDALRANLRALRGTTLGLDLMKVSEVRAMTGRVVEIRLSSPMPDFLQLLAQPELGLRNAGQSAGPMALTENDKVLELLALPPEARGLPRTEDWEEEFRPVHVHALSARKATEAFAANEVEIVLGGRIANLPLADTGALARGTVRLEAALGVFGLEIINGSGFLGSRPNREALAMAIDRQALLAPFNIGGWIPTTRIVAPNLPADSDLVEERWTDLNLGQRQAVARQRVATWKGLTGEDVTLTVSLPEGPGSTILFRELARAYAPIGVKLERAKQGARAQLRLKDRTARYGAARWFLNQFNCDVIDGPCSPEADRLVAEATRAVDPVLRDELLAEAERLILAENYFIPFGAPIRWSLVRAGVEGFSENAWGMHPLFPLSQGTI